MPTKNLGLRMKVLGSGPMMAGDGLNEPGQSSFLINVRNSVREFNVLVDCGTQAISLLRKHGMQLDRIDAVLITHTHPDHAGGLGQFLLGRRFPPPDGHKPILFVPDDLAEVIWPQLLRIQCQTLGRKKAKPSDFYELRPIKAGQQVPLLGGRAHLELVRVVHHFDDGEAMPCYGFNLTDGRVRMFCTGDSIYQLENLREHYLAADFVLQEMQPGGVLGQETIHTMEVEAVRPEEDGGLPKGVPPITWVYHTIPNPQYVKRLEDAGYLGIVAPGHTFHFEQPHTYLEPYAPMAGEYLGRREEDLEI